MTAHYQPDWSPLQPGFWPDVFGNEHPVAIEVGPGLGEFLQAISQAEPTWNFFAVEQDGKRATAVQRRIDRHQLINARVVWAPAEYVLSLLPGASVDRFHIQFPDPWWKRRHHRRRLMTRAFVAELRRTLKMESTIEFVSDVEDYFAMAQELLNADPDLSEVPTSPELLATTSFARKAAARGWKISASSHRKIR